MKDNSKKVIIILLIVTVLVVVGTYLLNRNKDNKKNEINIVTNYSDFYTVNSCLYRLMTYVSSEEKDSLIKILYSKYKKENNIDESNVISLFNKVKENSLFKSKKMYYEKVNKNITKYYVYGSIETNTFKEDTSIDDIESIDEYFIVYLDSSNHTFSIEPYTGDIFKDGVL